MRVDPERAVQVFSTCPPSTAAAPAAYPEWVARTAAWSERAGCTGTLIYSDHSLLDPWLVAQLVVQATDRLGPLVAVQPTCMSPHSAAKMVSSIAHLHPGRPVFLNMIAGGFRNDLGAMNDPTPHDRRYARLVEYTTILTRLLTDPAPLTFTGEFYGVTNLRLAPPPAPGTLGGVFVSGSSPAGLEAARALGATAVRYPEPDGVEPPPGVSAGIRVGVIARADRQEAWRIARARFPEDRRGQLTHQLAVKVSDSAWHRRLSELDTADAEDEVYWLRPFANYHTFCPYLVGDHERVAAELARYLGSGHTRIILDVPVTEDDLVHARRCVDRAAALAAPAGALGSRA
jgi:alkanesulfonate monooxygenase